jgi:hypothetical protein
MDWSYLAEEIRRRQLGLDDPLGTEGLPSTTGLPSATSNGASLHGVALGSSLLLPLSNHGATNEITAYPPCLYQQYVIEEQLRRDLEASQAQDYLIRRARLLGTLNSINANQVLAPTAFANTRIQPGFPGITEALVKESVQEPMKKKMKRVIASVPTFASRDGVAHKFPLPISRGEVARPVRVSTLSSFQSLWNRLHSDKSKVKKAFVNEIFARQVGRWNDRRTKGLLQQSDMSPVSDASRRSESTVDGAGSDLKPQHGKRKRDSEMSVLKSSPFSSSKLSVPAS